MEEITSPHLVLVCNMTFNEIKAKWNEEQFPPQEPYVAGKKIEEPSADFWLLLVYIAFVIFVMGLL
jgi:hypothetical protein